MGLSSAMYSIPSFMLLAVELDIVDDFVLS